MTGEGGKVCGNLPIGWSQDVAQVACTFCSVQILYIKRFVSLSPG